MNRRTGVPRLAILVSAVATLVIAVAAAIRPDGLDLLSSMVTVGALTAFVFLHVAVIGYYVVGRRTDRRVLHTVVPVVGLAIVVTVLVLASHLALEVAAGWLVLGLVIMLVRGNRRQDATNAGSGTRPARVGRILLRCSTTPTASDVARQDGPLAGYYLLNDDGRGSEVWRYRAIRLTASRPARLAPTVEADGP